MRYMMTAAAALISYATSGVTSAHASGVSAVFYNGKTCTSSAKVWAAPHVGTTFFATWDEQSTSPQISSIHTPGYQDILYVQHPEPNPEPGFPTEGTLVEIQEFQPNWNQAEVAVGININGIDSHGNWAELRMETPAAVIPRDGHYHHVEVYYDAIAETAGVLVLRAGTQSQNYYAMLPTLWDGVYPHIPWGNADHWYLGCTPFTPNSTNNGAWVNNTNMMEWYLNTMKGFDITLPGTTAIFISPQGFALGLDSDAAHHDCAGVDGIIPTMGNRGNPNYWLNGCDASPNLHSYVLHEVGTLQRVQYDMCQYQTDNIGDGCPIQ